MRRSICYTEPKAVLAGEKGTWKFIYSPAINLSKGAKLRFDMGTQGRYFDWEFPQTSARTKNNLIWLELPDGNGVTPKAISIEGRKFPQFEFTLPDDVKSGEQVVIYLGTSAAGEEKEKGNRAQMFTERRKPFFLYVDPKGKGDFKEEEVFHIDIRGNTLAGMRVIAPSAVNKNERFDVVVRFEDAYGNLTTHAPENTLIEFSYDQLRDNINWKLFVPETGFLNLPNLYFNEPGIYRIQLKNLATDETFFSSPIKCFADNPHHLYWGTFHGESEKFNSKENIENCLRQTRDEFAYHFYGTSSFESEVETSHDLWKSISNQIADFNEEDRFTTFLGMQWQGEPKEEGLRQIIYAKDNKPLLRKKESKSNNLKKIYKIYTPKDFISIPSFTMAKGCEFNFEDWNPEYEPVVEIYNAWGSSECTKKEGNLFPITTKSKKGIQEQKEGSIRAALNKNCRVGFVAGGLDDRGLFAPLYDAEQAQYTPGLTAIYATGHSRDAMMNALHKRSCYATTGVRIILGFEIAQEPMGSMLNVEAKPGLQYNRHISVFVVGTDQLQEVQMIRNGETLKTFHPESNTLDIAYDDMEPLDQHLLQGREEEPPFAYYYLRVIQKDGHVAWSSPIWIDHPVQENVAAKKAKKK